jgi:hypothetical protein
LKVALDLSRAAGIPGGGVCLISALAFHELTTQIPPAVDVHPSSASSSRPASAEWSA